MQLNLPKSDLHNQVRLTVSHPNWVGLTMTATDDHKTVEIPLPEGVDPNQLTITAHFCTDDKVDPRTPGVILVEPSNGKVEEPAKDPPAKPGPDEGQSGDANANEPHDSTDGDGGHPEDSSAGSAGGESVGEAAVEQVEQQVTVEHVTFEQAAEAQTHPMTRRPQEHHQPRRPKHAR